jgi:hypothetical protein
VCSAAAQWVAAIRTSLATYDDQFRSLLDAELGKGIKNNGGEPRNYGLDNEPQETATPGPK